MTQIVTIERVSSRSHFSWLLPGWFVVGVLLASVWPGHSWQLFGIGALPGVWLSFLMGAGGLWSWVLPTLLAGVPVLWFLGRLLDRLTVEFVLWIVAAIVGAAVAGILLLGRFVDLEAAFEQHGGFLPFAICSLQLGSYGATLLMLIVGAGKGVRR